MTSLIPVALSSEIDEHGKEHIHAAVGDRLRRPSYVVPPITYTDYIHFFSEHLIDGETGILTYRLDPGVGLVETSEWINPEWKSYYSLIPTNDASTLTLARGSLLRTYTIEQNGSLSSPTEIASANAFYGSYSPDGRLFVASSLSVPYVELYTRENNTLTKVPSQPSPLPPGQARFSSWTPDSQYCAVSVAEVTGVIIYKRVEDTLIRLPDPIDKPSPMTAASCAFSPDGNYLLVGRSASPHLEVFINNWDDTFTYIGHGYDVAPGSFYDYPRQISFTSDGSIVAMALNAGNRVAVYAWDGEGGLTKLPNPPNVPTSGQGFSCTWNGDNTHLLIGTTQTPYYHLWSYTDGVFTKLLSPVGMDDFTYSSYFVTKASR